jgi:enoyl-CoA hydratase/carnithine racemase
MLTGDRMSAGEAAQLGLVTRVVDPELVVPEAMALADRIAGNAPLAIRETLALLHACVDADEARCWQLSEAAARRLQASADAIEGSRAFTEKRAARWTGR